jgi:HSP20 family protein
MNSLIKRNNMLFSQWPMFDDFLVKEVFNSPNIQNSRINFPAVNIRETEKSWELEVIAPGIDKENIQIDLENNKLLVTATIGEQHEAEGPQDKYYRREYTFTGFKRSFTLPENLVNPEQVSAKHLNGVLYISLPKMEKEKPGAKKIEIQ